MRSLLDMATIQIEITNACVRTCSNCTRFCGHHEKPYFMDLNTFKKSVDSMDGYPRMVGVMGGEPLLHPEFESFCLYIQTKFKPHQLGLWTALPSGFERYNKLICDTFGNIFINDHSRNDVYHHPILVGADELITDKDDMYYIIDKCWVQNSWSASINPNGAFFCEVAAAWALLLGDKGWDVKSRWWTKTPKDFKDQIERFCHRCGCAMPLQRRKSIDVVDDISENNLDLLKGISKKINDGKYVLHDKTLTDPRDQFQMASYKEMDYRSSIARKYGMILLPNALGNLTPVIASVPLQKTSLFDLYKSGETKVDLKRDFVNS